MKFQQKLQEKIVKSQINYIKKVLKHELQKELIDDWKKNQKQFFDQLERFSNNFKKEIIEDMKKEGMVIKNVENH